MIKKAPSFTVVLKPDFMCTNRFTKINSLSYVIEFMCLLKYVAGMESHTLSHGM